MFITCMNALMSLQSLSLCEGFTASLTCKGSFARMNQLKERNANKCILSCSWHVHAGSTGGLQGNRYNENRDPAMKTGVPCNENRFFHVRIDLQGVSCRHYRVWVYSAGL